MTAFFENQALANRNSRLLVLLFIIAMIGIVLLTYGGIVAVRQYVYHDSKALAVGFIPESWSQMKLLATGQTFWDPTLFFSTAASLVTIIGAGSLFKRIQLGGGGAKVAQLMGGSLLMPHSQVETERKVLNIVEEMAIASGLPVPPVYVMAEEQSINAFAAGFKTDQAVIGVSQGAIERLTRDELQGVIAHEFSHILSGDMALNIRLMSLLHGIIVMTIIGRILLDMNGRIHLSMDGRILLGMNGSRRRSSSKVKNSNPFTGIGWVLVVVGYLGVLTARLIRLAISRQREFYADASAVQFTRNPLGIGSALQKLQRESAHGSLRSPHTEEVSHMFFADALKRKLGSLFATHPSLDERIRRIDTLASGQLIAAERTARAESQKTRSKESLADSATKKPKKETGFQLNPQSMILTAESILRGVGNINPASVSMATQLLAELPEPILKASRDPLEACLLSCCILLDDDPKVREQQIETLIAPSALFAAYHPAHHTEQEYNHSSDKLYSLHDALAPMIRQVKRSTLAERLALIEVALAALRLLSEAQINTLLATTDSIIQSDGNISIFEFCVDALITTQLRKPTAYSTARFPDHLNSLISCLVRLSDMSVLPHNIKEVETLLGMKRGALANPSSEQAGTTLENISGALAKAKLAIAELSNAPSWQKERILQACVKIAASDDHINDDEFQVIRVIALCFGCPVPLCLVQDEPQQQ
jgi:Zn-dependent protease with chaperone function